MFKIDNGQDQNCVFASVLHQLKGVPADYHPKHLWHQLTKNLIVMRELLNVSSFICNIYFLSTNIISQKHSQCVLSTYQTLFHKNFYSVCSVLTKHYFTKTFTVCALYLLNIISQKHSQCALYLLNIISQKHYIK